MKEDFRKIEDLIKQSLKSFNLEHKTRERGALIVWEDVVGARVAKAASADNIREGTLFVTCRTGTWANELTFMKADIIAKLNVRLGGKFVKDIRFSIRSRRDREAVDQVEEPAKPSEKELEEISLSAEEEQQIEQAATCSGNDELAARIRKALTASRKMDKWKSAHGWKKCDSCGSLFEDKSGLCPVCGK